MAPQHGRPRVFPARDGGLAFDSVLPGPECEGSIGPEHDAVVIGSTSLPNDTFAAIVKRLRRDLTGRLSASTTCDSRHGPGLAAGREPAWRHCGQTALEAGRATGFATRTAAHDVARPSAPHSTRQPSIRTSPSAGSNRTGIPVRMRRIASSALTPITESWGPVIPASVIAAVPPGSTRASEVWTCVCVPITAVTRPSSQRAIAIFSLVASACRSTTHHLRLRGEAFVDECVDVLERMPRARHVEVTHHVEHGDRRPVRCAGATVSGRPGDPEETPFDGPHDALRPPR